MPDPDGCYTSPHASLTDGLSHEIRDEDFRDGQATGVYRALCGAQVAVVDVFGPPCQACLALLRARRAAAAGHGASRQPVPQQRRSRLRVMLGVSS